MAAPRIRNLEEKWIFVRNVAKEISKLCASENLIVSYDLCAYLVDLMIINSSRDVSREDLSENLIKTCINYLKEEPLFIKSIKLQLNWREKYQSRDEIKRIHHERIFENVLPIMSEITDLSPVDKENFYKKIVIFVIMFAGLGSPTQQLIIKETQAALFSIFKSSEIDNFVNLQKSTKEQQLVEFARLITGIILFNKDCKKGGEGMDDLPLILTQGVKVTKERLLSFRDQLIKRIDHLVKGLSQSYCRNENTDSTETDSKNPEPSKLRKENFEKFKTLLIYYTQLKYYTNDLIKDLEKSFVVVKELVERLQTTLLQLHNVVRYRVAVATVQVFPLFVHLSDIWVEMQEEVDILSEINNNFRELSFAAKLQLTLPTPVEFNLSSSSDVISSENDDIKSSTDFHPGVRVCSYLSLSGQEYFQYEGFCAWSIAQMEGFLVPGNLTIGVLQYSNRFYTFSSAEAAHKWALNPKKLIKSVLNVTKTNPELIKLLNLYSDLESNFLENIKIRDREKPSKANVVIQTELHPLESNIDKEYTFSEWELKRRAIKLANLTKCVTKSQQTVKRSCFRADVGVQVTPNKSMGTQTERDGYCHPLFRMTAWKYTIDSSKSELEAKTDQTTTD